MDKNHSSIFLKQINATEQNLSQLQKHQIDYINSSFKIREKQISNLLTTIAKEPIAELDLTALNEYAQIAIQDQRIAYAAYYTEDGVLLASKGIFSPELEKRIYEIHTDEIKLGSLELGISDQIIKQQKENIRSISSNQINQMQNLMKKSLNNISNTMIVASIVVLVTTAISVYFLFNILVGKPLQRFVGIIKKLQKNDYTTEVPYKNKVDEIGDISNALDNFKSSLENIDRLQKEQIEKNKELKKAKEKVEHIAYVDEVTNIANRACFKRDFRKQLTANSSEQKSTLINILVDGIERVNDTMGHNTGDTLLREFSSRVENILSELNIGKVYRWYASEFVILVNTIDAPLINRLCSIIAEDVKNAFVVRNTPILINVNIGIAKFPADSTDLDSLFVHARLARYKSKEIGLNKFHFFTKELKDKAQQEIQIEKELRIAVKEKQLFLTYQPQIDIYTQEVTGVECLIRWNHPTKGILSPFYFLDVVENSDLAPIVGKYVIDEALSSARKWLDQNINFGRIAINLSPRHLQHGELLSDLMECVEKYHISPEYITTEILESLLLDESGNQLKNVQKLYDLGFHVELDDFGTGYASLSHMSQMPIHGIKVDKSFTQKMLTDKREEVVIQALINMAKLMQLSIVCEGVETIEEVSKISQFGQCSLQGYLITRPIDYDNVTEMLASGIKLPTAENSSQKTA